ncbi:MAG: Rieske (2Fe-2S) protein [Vicinamibacteria bacterium]
MSSALKVGRRSDLGPGAFRCVEAGGKRVVVYNVDGALYATADTCAHQGGPLGEGLLEGSVVTCPWHAWQFDVRTGVSVYDPRVRVATYPVKVIGDDILIEV